LDWNWGGQVVFDWNWDARNAFHTIRSSLVPPGHRVGGPTNAPIVETHGFVEPTVDVPCAGGPPLTNNTIDSSRVFVRWHYIDFLGRKPEGDDMVTPPVPSDLPGWNYWTSNISQCVFDLNCTHAKRISTGLAFFYSAEFSHTDPDLANPPGSPGFNAPVYNRAFVRYCYIKYLGVDPIFDDDGGWDFWTNVLNNDGNYAHMIDAFQVCGDYRDRFPSIP
jgi:hypothetical protein